jgi:hypothetical protein
MNKHFAIALLGTTLLAGSAFAQTSTAPSSDPAMKNAPPAASSGTMNTTPPAANRTMDNSSTSGSAMNSSTSASGANFIAQAQPDQWRASKLVGVDVYGPDNNKVGDINDALIGSDGMVQAVVIGVGGFLGMGEKNVALPFNALQWSDQPMQSDRAATNTPAGGASANANNKPMDYPDHAKLSMTKEQLQNAPTFKYASAANDSRDTSAAPTGGTTGTRAPGGTTAPAR